MNANSGNENKDNYATINNVKVLKCENVGF